MRRDGEVQIYPLAFSLLVVTYLCFCTHLGYIPLFLYSLKFRSEFIGNLDVYKKFTMRSIVNFL